ncbi:hypothetical protein FQN54_002702 [Arachnomyces sp. PD_36]|nr:hypothetical protein FQN54_002702 [Arachnomyces sp. PD_36]
MDTTSALLSLPNELIILTFRSVSTIRDALNLAATCHQLQLLLSEHELAIFPSVDNLSEAPQHDLIREFSPLVRVPPSTWWLQGTRGFSFIIDIHYDGMPEQELQRSAVRNIVSVHRGRSSRRTSLLKFLAQFHDNPRLSSYFEPFTCTILSSAARLQEDNLLLSEFPDLHSDSTVIAAALDAFVTVWELGVLDGYIAGGAMEADDDPLIIFNTPQYQRDGMVPAIQIRTDSTSEKPEQAPSPDGWETENLAFGLEDVTRRCREMLLRGEKEDWPTVSYVICILNLITFDVSFIGYWDSSLTSAVESLKSLVTDLCRLYYICTRGGYPLGASRDREWYQREVDGNNERAVRHFHKLNELWLEWQSDLPECLLTPGHLGPGFFPEAIALFIHDDPYLHECNAPDAESTAAMKYALLSIILAGAISEVTAISRRQSTGTATIDLAASHGEATFLGSGFIYGWPDNGREADTSIPESLVTGIKFNSCRAGGAQIEAPGWAYGGYDGYIGRFESTLSNYLTTRKYGGDLIMLVHDMWGAQGGANSETPFPGDDGDWTEMETFLTQLIDDVKANDMLDGLVIDLWNEPDGEGFWARSWEQFVEYYVRAHQIMKSAFPDTPISGPSMAGSPSPDDTNWTEWMSAISGNDTVPDRYSWHQIGTWEREPDTTLPDFDAMRATYSLPERPIDINEYAWTTEQNPANSAYYIAQLERHDMRGLRSNWGSGSDLHDYMANLLYKDESGTYQPNGEWYLYNYYANMTGDRLTTAASEDRQFDVFATSSNDTVKILAGTRTIQAAYDISVSGLSELGFPSDGSIPVRTYQFDWNGATGAVDSPVDVGCEDYQSSSDSVSIAVDPPTDSTAFAFELSVGGC